MFKSKVTSGMLAAIGLSLALLVSGCAPSDSSGSGANAGANSAELTALIKEAQKEGPVSVYAVPDERIIQQVQKAYTEAYGVQMSYVRLTAADIASRFNAEAAAKAPVADIVLDLDDGFISSGLKSGALRPLEDAKIPGYPNTLAKEAVRTGSATVQLAKLAIAYNTDKVKSMSSWNDLLAPALKGKVAIANPSGGVYNALFYKLSQNYGGTFLKDLGGQVGRVYTSGSQIIEAISSGEMYAVAGTLASAVEIAKTQGAPIAAVVPSPTLMAPAVMAMNANAPRPAAARLFAYFLTTKAGLDALNSGPGMVAPTSSEEIGRAHV